MAQFSAQHGKTKMAPDVHASGAACCGYLYIRSAGLHVGPIAVQRILRVPVTVIVQVPALTGTNIGLT